MQIDKKLHKCYINHIPNDLTESKNVIDGDSLKDNSILLKNNGKHIVTYSHYMPTEEILKKSKIPIIILTTKQPPLHIKKYCYVYNGKITAKKATEMWMRGDNILDYPYPNKILMYVAMNAHRLWDNIPEIMFRIDLASGKQLARCLSLIRPSKFPEIKWFKDDVKT